MTTKTYEISLSKTSSRWQIEVQDDSGGRATPLVVDRPVRVGSSRACDVVIEDPTVSGGHLELVAGERFVVARDLSSKNGTFIGGARAREVEVAAGSIINVGFSTVIVRQITPDEEEPDPEPLRGVIGASREMRRVAAQVRRLAQRRSPVLVLGESGVGKELVARALHVEGPRWPKPFVAVNMTAMPRDLVESELFGHERGAFTGAVNRRAGAFEQAADGTLFLDEIGDLPIELQPKLLRALDGYEIRRVGGSAGYRGEARVVAATNASLENKVEDNTFRRDLYHRLEVFVVRVPPLRERRGDICAIAKHIARRLDGDGPRTLTTAALSALAAQTWPGNVRELTNVLTRAADLARDEEHIDGAHVARALGRKGVRTSALTPSLAKAILRDHGGNISAAARASGVARTTFRKVLVAD